MTGAPRATLPAMAVFRCIFDVQTGRLLKDDGTIATYTRKPGESDADFELRAIDDYGLEVDAHIRARVASCSKEQFEQTAADKGFIRT